MLSELLTFLTTPCPKHVRRMGYLYEAIAIAARHKRRAASWRSHMERSKAFILRAIEACTDRGKAVVLGSGLLLDLPLEELSAAFDEVVLVDMIHMRPALSRLGQFHNVRTVCFDITGVAQRLYESGSKGICELPEPDTVFPEVDEKTGLVVSLNILSQLPVIPGRYAARMGGRDRRSLENWEFAIMEGHYKKILSLDCCVCLITDYESIHEDSEGRELERLSTIGSLELPLPDETWLWDIAPRGEISGGRCEKLAVAAIIRPPQSGDIAAKQDQQTVKPSSRAF